MESADARISDMLVEKHAIACQIGVMLIIRISDACVQVRYAELPQKRLETIVQPTAQPLSTLIFTQVNGDFNAMAISRP